MELPRRSRGDELLKPGEYTRLRNRLRAIAPAHDLKSVIACAFDHRTSMLPFLWADMHMVPAGVRAIGSALVDAGFEKTRIVLQQWNRNFRPSEMKIDGSVPDLFLVSSMQIHSVRCKELIYDACGIDAAHRPLIIAGGPKVVYEPWDVFSDNRNDRWGADVAVTGEEFVLLSLLEVLLSMRVGSEPMRAAFLRARNSGILDEIPGLVYARTDADGVAEELVDTGVQRLLADMDELPHPVMGYRLLERPSRRATLTRVVEPGKVKRLSPLASLVLTSGCKFNCPYCPIPAYNQRQHRLKSPDRIVDEMRRLYIDYGIKYFFGADDNFFNHHDRTREIVETLARANINGKPFHKCVGWGTEVTVHDTLALRDDLPMVRGAGVMALWLGVEDMTATFIKKGQSVSRTQEAFQLLRRRGICPMPMMMHHDTQPLYTRGGPYGLLNQVKLLRKAGATSLQVLMMTPATGSALYESAFTDGLTIESAGGRKVEPHMMDGNYVVATAAPRPWTKQFNILIAYFYFYNPLRLATSLLRRGNRLRFQDTIYQLLGIRGVALTFYRTVGWAFRLMRGPIQRRTNIPCSRLPMRGAASESASHALPGTPTRGLVQIGVIAGAGRT